MSDKSKLCKAIIGQGAVGVDDLSVEAVAADEEGATWRVRLKRDVSFIWGGVERTLPARAVLGLVYIDFADGETTEDVPYIFLEQPDTWGYSVDALEREMLDAD